MPCLWNRALKSAKLDQLILYAMHFNWAEVQLKIYWSVFEYAKR